MCRYVEGERVGPGSGLVALALRRVRRGHHGMHELEDGDIPGPLLAALRYAVGVFRTGPESAVSLPSDVRISQARRPTVTHATSTSFVPMDSCRRS